MAVLWHFHAEQVDSLRKELETQTKKRDAVEARLNVAEKKVLDLNLKLESVSMMHILVYDRGSIMEYICLRLVIWANTCWWSWSCSCFFLKDHMESVNFVVLILTLLSPAFELHCYDIGFCLCNWTSNWCERSQFLCFLFL